LSRGGNDRSGDIGGQGRPLRRFAATPRVELLTPSGATIEAVVAGRPIARLLGLAAVDRERAPALLIPRCRSVHTAWMRFALDVVFLRLPEGASGDAPVLSVHPSVPRRRVVAARGRGSRDEVGRPAALELAPGSAARLGIEPGRALRLRSGTGAMPA